MFDKNSPFISPSEAVAHGEVTASTWSQYADPYQVAQEAEVTVAPMTNKVAWLPVQDITISTAVGSSWGQQDVQLVATATDAQGETVDVTKLVVWASSALNIMTVNAVGKVHQTDNCGTSTITATLGTVVGTLTDQNNGWC